MDDLKRALPLLVFFLTGCQVPYIAKSAWSQADLLWSRVPIEDALKDPEVPDEQKKKLRLAQDARQFAETQLHLKPTNNYTGYVDLKRPYVTWVVSAAPKDKLEHHTYWFPVIGSVPYKGFFDPEGAENEAKKLREQGLDVFVRGVTAYSTLGWFNDPLTSAMLRRPDYELVNTIIHETVHATVYIKSKSDFNERLATFIGDKGMEKYYQSLGDTGQQTLQSIARDNDDQKTFTDFISKEIKDLDKWYTERSWEKETVDLETARQKKFSELRERFAKLQFKEKGAYGGFLKAELNNARLLTYRLYMQDLSDFELAFAGMQGDFEKFVQFCKGLEGSNDPISDMKNAAKTR